MPFSSPQNRELQNVWEIYIWKVCLKVFVSGFPFKKGQIRSLFCLFFVLYTWQLWYTLHHKGLKRGWDSNPGWQNGRLVQINWAIVAPEVALLFNHQLDRVYNVGAFQRKIDSSNWTYILIRFISYLHFQYFLSEKASLCSCRHHLQHRHHCRHWIRR